MQETNTGIRKANLHDGPDPWAASVTVWWEVDARDWGRRKRWRRLKKILGGLELDTDYQHREDIVMDSTIIYFRNKDDAVNAYFYFS